MLNKFEYEKYNNYKFKKSILCINQQTDVVLK